MGLRSSRCWHFLLNVSENVPSVSDILELGFRNMPFL